MNNPYRWVSKKQVSLLNKIPKYTEKPATTSLTMSQKEAQEES